MKFLQTCVQYSKRRTAWRRSLSALLALMILLFSLPAASLAEEVPVEPEISGEEPGPADSEPEEPGDPAPEEPGDPEPEVSEPEEPDPEEPDPVDAPEDDPQEYPEDPALTLLASLSVAPEAASLGEVVSFTVCTDPAVQFLTMFAESGARVKTWEAEKNSQVEDGVRTWTIPYAFANMGQRVVTFRAAVTEDAYGESQEVAVAVLSSAVVSSAKASPTAVL